jgi:hypothetical protein
MGAMLVRDPWVDFYLLYVTTLSIAWAWDYVRRQTAVQGDSRTSRNETVRKAPGLSPFAAGKNAPTSGPKPGRRTDKEVKPVRDGPGRPAMTDPTRAPS